MEGAGGGTPHASAQIFLLGAALLALLLYVADAELWPARWLPAVVGIGALAFGSLNLGLLLLGAGEPEAPHVFWGFALPAALWAVRATLCRRAPPLPLLRLTALGLLLAGGLLLAVWGAWVADGAAVGRLATSGLPDVPHDWATDLLVLKYYVLRSECARQAQCHVAVLLWLGPALAAAWCFLLAAAALFVSRSPDATGLAHLAKLLPVGVRAGATRCLEPAC